MNNKDNTSKNNPPNQYGYQPSDQRGYQPKKTSKNSNNESNAPATPTSGSVAKKTE